MDFKGNNRSQFKAQTYNFKEDAIDKLASLFPETVNDGKINFELLKSILSNDLEEEIENEKYDFTWRGKANARKIAYKPAIKTTLVKNIDKSKKINDTNNIYIEGDNLEVLKLLQSPYKDKIKVIYIDPPYNTGKDFVYHDNFSQNYNDYLKQTGQIDSNGHAKTTNKETNGRFHTDWLNMMYPRLKLANNLLSEDGVIFINIDDTEVFNLKKIIDEIFGESNFLADIIWNSTKSVTNTAIISESTTHTLTYFKDINYFIKHRDEFRIPDDGSGFANPDNDSRGPWKADPFQVEGERKNQLYGIKNPKTGKVYYPNPGSSWKNSKDKFNELVNDNRIVFGKNGDSSPQRKRFLFEALERGKVSKTLWDDVGTTTNGTARVKELFGSKVFSNPKPVGLLKRIIQLGGNKDSIILDFFAGSSTTAEAVMDVNNDDHGNRKFILVQLPEDLEDSLKYATGDNKQVLLNAIEYTSSHNLPKNIASIGQERVRLAGDDISLSSSSDYKLDDGFQVFELSKSNFKQWDDDPEQFENQLELFKNDPFVEGSSKDNIAREIAIKSGIELNCKYSEHNDIYHFEDEDKEVFVILGAYDMELFKILSDISQKSNSLVVIKELTNGSEIKFNLIDYLKQNPKFNNKFRLEWI